MSAALTPERLVEIGDLVERAREAAGRATSWSMGEYDAITAALDAVPALLADVERSQYAAGRVTGLLEAAEIVDNDDDCGCGGCDTCIPRALAAEIRDRAKTLAAERGGSRG